MNKIFFQSVVALATLMFGSAALAQVTTSPNNPIVATGGTVVFKDQALTVPLAAAIDDTIVLRLPAGVNFSGTPTATGTGFGLQLQTNSSGDPGDNGLVTLSDTNADGLNDHASVKVAASASGTAGTVTWKGSLVYSGTGDSGTLMSSVDVFDTSASVFLLANAAGDLADLVTAAAAPAPIALQNADVVSVENVNDPYRAFSSPATYVIEIGIGLGTSASNNTITVNLGTGIQLDGPTNTVVSTPAAHTDGAPGITVGTIADDGTSFDLTIDGATSRPSQYSFTVTGYETVGQSSPTAVNLTLTGDAGVTGTVLGADLAATGSTTMLVTMATPVALIRDADQTQPLPSFEITELFASDFVSGTTITLVAPAGMTFDPSNLGSTSSSDTTTPAAIGTHTVNTGNTELTIPITTAGALAETLTVQNVRVKAASSAAESLSITVGKSGKTGESANAPFTALAVATAANRGTVTIAGQTPAGKVGVGTTANMGVISLSEETYGAINTNSSFPVIEVTPPTGITITGIAAANTGATTFAFGPDAPSAAIPADGSWIVPVQTESDSKVLDTAPLTLTVTYNVASTVTPGTAVTFDLGGDVQVSGSAKVADVLNTTISRSTGVIPDRTSSAAFVSTATLSVAEEFDAALDITAGQFFRVIAPAGITFASTQPTTLPAPVVAISADTTFTVNDTLLVELNATVNSDTITVTPNVFVSGAAAAGFNTFTIIDGDTNDANGANVTSATVDLVYVGTVDAPSGGADITVAQGFSASQAITGGLAAITSSSADTGVATVANTDTLLTVTGVAAGTAVVTVTDALNVTDTVSVTVVAAAAQTSLTTVNSSGGSTTATITGGVTTDNGATFDADGAVDVGDAIQIVFTIAVDASHVGMSGDLYVAVLDTSVANGQIWTIGGGALVPLESGQAIFATRTLAASESINVLGGAYTVTSAESGAQVSIFAGYSVDGGTTIIYNSEAIPLTVN